MRLIPFFLVISCSVDPKTEGDSAAPTDSSAPVDVDVDADEDGFKSDVDCDDDNPAIHPDQLEICDGLDNDCDGLIDDEDDTVDPATQSEWFGDADGDGYGIKSLMILACESPEGYTADRDGVFDCDDTDDTTHPGALETDCDDDHDYNCDGAVGYADIDGDGFAACEECNDADPSIHPDAIEVCDHIDNNCDGNLDDDDHALDLSTRSQFFIDADGDGFGDEEATINACFEPEGAVTADDDIFDCDDTEAEIHPGADEVCDGIDNDCDALIDDADPSRVGGGLYYIDHDHDGFGSADYTINACAMPAGYASTSEDCDDLSADTHPEATELCDGDDNDCDGIIDNGLDLATHYRDLDGDGFGDEAFTIESCGPPEGYTATGDDCDDSSALSHPEAIESCLDGLDNDCDEETDCDDIDDCRGIEPSCWLCGDGYVDPGEECDDGDTISGDGCDAVCHSEISLSDLDVSWISEGRTVYVWKSDSTAALSSYTSFCEDHGLAWFTPDSAADAQKVITDLYTRDFHHTWIITKNTTTTSPTWGGYAVTVDSPDCVNTSSSGFSAIRKWGCSMCEPDDHGTTRCWDADHSYDWLVCEDA